MRAGLQHKEPDRRINAHNWDYSDEACWHLERPPHVKRISILVHNPRGVGQGLTGEHRAVRVVLVVHEDRRDEETCESEEDVAGEAIGQVQATPRVRLHDAQIRVGAHSIPEASGTLG